MTTQPEALRMAVRGAFRGGLTLGEIQEAEDELNRLTRQHDALLGALRVFVSCASPVSTEIDERGYRWIQAYLDQALPIARAAIRAVEDAK